MDRLRAQLAVQAELAKSGDGIFRNFLRPNAILMYGQPNVGKLTEVQTAFAGDGDFDHRIFDLKDSEPHAIINRLTDSSSTNTNTTTITMYVTKNQSSKRRHRVIIIRHLEQLLRPDISVEVQDYMAQAIVAAKKRRDTTIIGTLGGNIPTAFIPSLRGAFDFQYHCPLPTPEDRLAFAKDLMDIFIVSPHDDSDQEEITNELTDEDWEQFVDASRYADYGLIRAFLRRLVCNINGLWIANGKREPRRITGDLMRRTYETWDNTPCIVEADLQARSMHTRNYALSRTNNDVEYVPADTIKDPTATAKGKEEEGADEEQPKRKKRRRRDQ